MMTGWAAAAAASRERSRYFGDMPIDSSVSQKRGVRRKGFPDDVVNALRKSKVLRIRAGDGAHRFIGIWFVMVDGRVFVRSWSLKAGGWYRTFLAEAHGAIQIGDREAPVRAVRTRSESLKLAVDRAYLEKYTSAGEIKYAKDLVEAKCRAATLELIPVYS